MATSQNGWPASANKSVIGIDSNFSVAGVKFPGGVKAGDVATVLHYVASQFHERVERLHDGWCWGWAYRSIRGSTRNLSNHAAGCAIDVNAPNHPLGKRGTFDVAQVKAINAIVAECDGVVRWGGTYSRPDEMHFEVIGNAAAVARVAAKLRAAAISDTGPLRLGSTGERVARLQRILAAWYPHLNLQVDGDFGPATEAAVKELQRRQGLTIDGIAGPRTLTALGIR